METDTIINLIWLLAGFVNGVTSYGSNLVATPLITLFEDPQKTVVLSCLSVLFINILVTFIYRHEPPWKDLAVLTVSSACGAPFGTLLLGIISPRVFLLVLASIMTVFLAWQMAPASWKTFKGRISLWGEIPFGFLFGMLYVVTSMPGPVLVICGLLRKWNRNEMMFMMNGLGVIGALMASFSFWQTGQISGADLSRALHAGPYCVAGVLLSIPVLRRMSNVAFKKGVLLMLAFSTLVLIYRSFLF